MTQEEKQLLLIDLSARLSYKVKGLALGGKIDTIEVFVSSEYPWVKTSTGLICYLDNGQFKPYLRPMSSMTDEEVKEYRNLSDEVIGSYGPYHHEFIVHCVRLGIKPDNPHECIDGFLNMEAIDWLNAHHFDYRIDPSTGKTLIESGLAIEAPEGMYKIE